MRPEQQAKLDRQIKTTSYIRIANVVALFAIALAILARRPR